MKSILHEYRPRILCTLLLIISMTISFSSAGTGSGRYIKEPVSYVLYKLSQAYNVQIRYVESIDDLTLVMSHKVWKLKHLNVEVVLNALEATGAFNYQLEGNTVRIYRFRSYRD